VLEGGAQLLGLSARVKIIAILFAYLHGMSHVRRLNQMLNHDRGLSVYGIVRTFVGIGIFLKGSVPSGVSEFLHLDIHYV
jgi:hypothetical protein